MGVENFSLDSSEKVPEISQEQVVAGLITNPEDVTLLTEFVDQLQEKVLRGQMTDFDLNIALAETYALVAQNDPSFNEYASQCYYDAAILANQEGNGALRDKLLAKSKGFSAS